MVNLMIHQPANTYISIGMHLQMQLLQFLVQQNNTCLEAQLLHHPLLLHSAELQRVLPGACCMGLFEDV
jgi:hypothetical protein